MNTPNQFYITVASPTMSDCELLSRAREAYLANNRWLPRWLVRRIRAGLCDWRIRGIVAALRDLAKPHSVIVADRDESTVALIMRTTPNLPRTDSVAAALLTAIRVGRRG